MDSIKAGRAWAWFGFLLGITASIAANVVHSYFVQIERGQSNMVGPLIGAGFWPLALFLCLEVMSRVNWPRGFQWWAVRYLGLSVVAAIAAVVSWRHMKGLLATYGEDWFVSMIGPVAIDGLMVLCSAALLAIADNIKQSAVVERTPKKDVHDAEDLPPPELPRSKLPPPKPERPREKLPQAKRPPTRDRNAEAVAVYQEAATRGEILTGEQIGEMFERSARWGRDRVNDAKAEPNSSLQK